MTTRDIIKVLLYRFQILRGSFVLLSPSSRSFPVVHPLSSLAIPSIRGIPTDLSSSPGQLLELFEQEPFWIQNMPKVTPRARYPPSQGDGRSSAARSQPRPQRRSSTLAQREPSEDSEGQVPSSAAPSGHEFCFETVALLEKDKQYLMQERDNANVAQRQQKEENKRLAEQLQRSQRESQQLRQQLSALQASLGQSNG